MAAFAGPCPEGLEVRHLDGDPANNRLTNLCYGTHSENVQDSLRHGTHAQARKDHCNAGHEFTPENTYIRPDNGYRQCRTCYIERSHERRARTRV